MANSYYDNSNEAQRFQPGTTARAEEVDAKFDQVATGFDQAEGDIDRSLKLPGEGASQELDASAFQRRNRVVGFDKDGNLSLLTGFTWRGDWAASTEYFINDILVEPATGDWYRVTLRHTSGATFSAVNLTLALDVATLNQLKAAAESARDLSLQYRDESRTARNASQSAQGLSETARDKSQAWAETPEDTAVELGAYSSLHHKAKSQQAQTASETARDASQTARDASQQAQGLSEQARDASQQAKAASESARDLSQQYRNESQAARTASQTAQTGSETARDKSQAWAETPEDTAVELGAYSSLHHKAKSQQAQALSESARDLALQYRNDSQLARDTSVAAQTDSQAIYDAIAPAQAQTNALLGLGIGSSYVTADGDLVMTYNDATVTDASINTDGNLTITY